LDFKPNVVLDLEREMVIVLPAIERAHQKVGVIRGAYITSARDSVHGKGSLHPKGLAIDLRTRDLEMSRIIELASEIKATLGKNFDVVIEQDHLHVEYDPD
jgi:hypothetical protein